MQALPEFSIQCSELWVFLVQLLRIGIETILVWALGSVLSACVDPQAWVISHIFALMSNSQNTPDIPLHFFLSVQLSRSWESSLWTIVSLFSLEFQLFLFNFTGFSRLSFSGPPTRWLLNSLKAIALTSFPFCLSRVTVLHCLKSNVYKKVGSCILSDFFFGHFRYESKSQPC